MSSLYNVIGTSTPEQLLSDPQGADVIAIPVEPGNGTIHRGTILYRKTNGMYAPAATADVVNTNNLVVLNEEVDSDANMTVSEDASAYRAGHMIAGKVTLRNDGIVTSAHAVVLRGQGIILDPMESASTFDNMRRVITYKANNGIEPAEADVIRYENDGAAHSVLANTVTDFTAPVGEAFSKWNTNSDGSGTDYAAAASYTANADLTLFAIWA